MMKVAADIKKHTPVVDESAVSVIAKYCGIAMRSLDASPVSATDPRGLATVRDGFAAKKSGLSHDAADASIKAVAEKTKGAPQ